MADDAFSQFGQGMERGVKLAQHAEQLTQQREQLEEAKKLNLIKVGDAVMESYNNAATLKDPKARKVAFDEARHKATLLGYPVSEASHSMLSSDTFRNELLQASASMLGLPDAQRAENYGSIGTLLRDPKLLQNTLMGIGDRLAKEASAEATARSSRSMELAKMTDEIRRERNSLPVTKNTAEIASAYAKIQGAVNNPSPAGDLSMIFGYMKMLDPASSVKEGEQASAQNTAGVPERVWGLYNRVIKGERLTPEQRKDFFQQSHGLYAAQATRQTQVDKTYTELARSRGMNPQHLFVGFGGQEELDQQTLAAQQKIKDRTQAAAGQAPADQASKTQIKPGSIDPKTARLEAYAIHGIDPNDAQADQKLNRALIIKYRPEQARKLGLIPDVTAKSGGRK